MNTYTQKYNCCIFICIVVCCVAFYSLTPLSAKSLSKKMLISCVVTIDELAVILPEMQYTREDWGVDKLWTPTVEQVVAAEKAVLTHLKKPPRKPAIEEPKVRYLVQYYGIVLENKEWIVCGIYDLDGLREEVKYSHNPKVTFNDLLVKLLTEPYYVNDSKNWIMALYDPSTNRLSESIGDLNNKPGRR